jgi:hypothetical protein
MIFAHIDVQNPRRRRLVQRSCGKGMLPEQGFLLAQYERGSKREGMEHQYKKVTFAHLVQDDRSRLAGHGSPSKCASSFISSEDTFISPVEYWGEKSFVSTKVSSTLFFCLALCVCEKLKGTESRFKP